MIDYGESILPGKKRKTMNMLDILLKLLLAIALGGIIGLEREASQKPAGLRTTS